MKETHTLLYSFLSVLQCVEIVRQCLRAIRPLLRLTQVSVTYLDTINEILII